jgi:hypothetical protein
MQVFMRVILKKWSLYSTVLGCVAIVAIGWLAACSGTSVPATDIPVTIVFESEPTAEGVNPPLPSGSQSPSSNGFVLDASTPAPPSGSEKIFTSPHGVSFNYPANWFTLLKGAENVVMVLNAPPDGIYAHKQGGDFRAISVGLKPKDITAYGSMRAYVEAEFLPQCLECKVHAFDELPRLAQGYTVLCVMYQGEGERIVLFVTNGQHLVELSTSYTPDEQSAGKYMEVLDQIANTLVIP